MLDFTDIVNLSKRLTVISNSVGFIKNTSAEHLEDNGSETPTEASVFDSNDKISELEVYKSSLGKAMNDLNTELENNSDQETIQQQDEEKESEQKMSIRKAIGYMALTDLIPKNLNDNFIIDIDESIQKIYNHDTTTQNRDSHSNEEMYLVLDRDEQDSETTCDYGWFETEDNFQSDQYFADQFLVLNHIDAFHDQDAQSVTVTQVQSTLSINDLGQQWQNENCQNDIHDSNLQKCFTVIKNINTISEVRLEKITPTESPKFFLPLPSHLIQQQKIVTEVYLEKNYAISTKCFSLSNGAQITVACAITGFRIVNDLNEKQVSTLNSLHAEYQVVVCSGDKTFTAWRRYSQFVKLANRVLRLYERTNSRILGKTVNYWTLLEQNMLWFRCLNFEYLYRKYQRLDTFLRELLLELKTPTIIVEFVSSTLKNKST